MARDSDQNRNVFERDGTSLYSEEEGNPGSSIPLEQIREFQAYIELKQYQAREFLRRRMKIKKKAKRFFDRLFSQRVTEAKKVKLTCL